MKPDIIKEVYDGICYDKGVFHEMDLKHFEKATAILELHWYSKLKAKLDVILYDDDIHRSLDIYIEEIIGKIESRKQ